MLDFQTFIRSPNSCAVNQFSCFHVQTFFVLLKCLLRVHQLLCVQPTYVCSCPDFRAFNRTLCVHVRTSVRSLDLFAFTRFFCVHVKILVRPPDFRAFMSRLECVYQTLARSCSYFRAFLSRFLSVNRLSCPHVQTFERLPDFCAFIISFVRSSTFVRSMDIRWFMSRLSCVQQNFVR